ncbi:MAG: hypothetical protein LUQ71_09465 [Methanoregula sp.]|nr:hypothetical protein [Methanoregula sp.]
MNFKSWLLLAVCTMAVIAAGCTNVSQAPVTPSQSPSLAASPAVPATPLAGVTDSGCANDVCSVMPPTTSPEKGTSLRIEASPRRYSPIMSSTPGVGLAPNATGFNVSAAAFTWNASYGRFLSWNAPDYTVNQLGAAAFNSGGKLYWSFTDKPSSTSEPVIITVSAKDPVSGAMLGTSTVTLAWDGDYAVTVQDIR